MTARPSITALARRCLFLALPLCGPMGAATAQPAFDEQRKAVVASTATQPEQAILTLLDAGLAESKPTQAYAVAQDWLRDNVPADPLLLYKAGRAAELSGDWKSAAALYRQYLKRADLASASASDAVLATYTLLINQLDDTESAYAFARGEGNALAASAQARQFDRWFLHQAQRRGDSEAVAARLLALVRARVPDDLLVALYHADFRWLLGAIVDARLDTEHFSPRFVQSVKALAGEMDFDPELALLLDWEVSVKAYNRAVLDGKQADLPLAEAQALLKRFPAYAARVQTGWAGGSRGQYYRDNPKKYFPLDREAKLAPVTAAVARLDAVGRAEFYRSWSPGYYAGGPEVHGPVEARALVLRNPELVNDRFGPALAYEPHRMSVDEARKLAPALEHNPGPEAAMVAAMAAAGDQRDFEKAVQALLGSEAWRLNEADLNGRYLDTLWQWAGRPGGDTVRDRAIARARALADTIRAGDVKRQDPAAERVAVLRRLLQDFRSPRPATPGVWSRLVRVLRVTPEALPELLGDPGPEARLLARAALEAGMSGDDPAWAAYGEAAAVVTDRYDPCIERLARIERVGDPGQLKQRRAEKYLPHPIETVLRAALEAQLKRGDVSPWLVLAWLNTQFPEPNDASVKLADDLVRSAVWKTLPYEVRRGVRVSFGEVALTPAQRALVASADPGLICRPLLTLAQTADAATTAEALRQTIRGLRASPIRSEVLGLDRLAGIGHDVFVDPAVLEQVYQIVGPLRSFQADFAFGSRLFDVVEKRPSPEVVHGLAPYLWRHTELHHRTLARLIALADALAAEHPSAAEAVARCGLETFARYSRGHMYFDRAADIPRLTAIRGKAAMAMGLINIPVPRSHPAYGVYQSQAEFAIGNADSARKLYLDHADQLMPVCRRLTVPYLLWVLRYTIEQHDQARQEELVKALLAWMQESAAAFTLEQRVALEIAYGDIAVQRGLLPEAQKIFARVAANPQYESVYLRHTATLRRVLVERLSGDFDGALQALLELDAQKVPALITEAHYARAEVYYAMEDYQRAGDEAAKVLERDPGHADATILRGRIQLKLQKLVEATEVELGTSSSQETLVPGQTLKVTLNDPTLAVSSGGTDIEVVVWAGSGDREHVLLRQFGDQKTKYRGEVATALGKPQPDDRTLQIVGDDQIHYAYSEGFRAKMPGLGESRGGPIRVASDAVMMASARKLLSENEQRAADMRAVAEVVQARYGGQAQNLDPDLLAELQREAAERARRDTLQARVKPGNPIYVRVLDPDRSRTAEVDELSVGVAASSGDSIARVVLRETEPYSGRFEGRIATVRAQAMAWASSTEAGRNPNMVISPKKDYPAWRPESSESVDHALTIDLNDNAPIAALRVVAADEGHAIRAMLLQTALKDGEWTTVAAYPANRMTLEHPWRPSVTVVAEAGRYANEGARPIYESLTDIRRHLATGWLAAPGQAIARNVAGPSEALPASIPTDVKWLREGRHPNPAVIARFHACFYETSRVTRRFALELGGRSDQPGDRRRGREPGFLIAIDGRVISSAGDAGPRGAIDLGPGVHRLEIWASGWLEDIGFGRSVKLRANLDDPDTLVDCPDSWFDPAAFPAGAIDPRNAPASITADQKSGEFQARFAPGSRARLLRIVVVDHEGDVPSINRVTLDDPRGKTLLPVPEDFAELRKNDTLEIVTGDKVTVRYTDDRCVTKGRQNQERFLNVSYTDARAEFADVEPRFSSRHRKPMPYYESLLRFAYHQPLSMVVSDADMDVSDEPDRVACTLTNGAGVQRVLEAVETGPSTGVFRAWITPVPEATDDPGRIQADRGGALTLAYRDDENLSPGVPYDRVASITHAAYSEPVIEVANMTVEPCDPATLPDAAPSDLWQPLRERLEAMDTVAPQDRGEALLDRILPRYAITRALTAMKDAPEGGPTLVHGRHALIEVVAPHLALRTGSSVEVYLQTDAGRAAAASTTAATPPASPAAPSPSPSAPATGPAAEGARAGTEGGFDISAPGTVRFTARLEAPPRNPVPERGGYVSGFAQRRGGPEELEAISLKTGRFRVEVPLIAGPSPERSFALPIDPDERPARATPDGLTVRTGERVHIGVSFTDEQGRPRWTTASATVITRPMLDLMQPDYREPMTEAHVGQSVCLRVVDFARDRGDDRDSLEVYLAAKSGARRNVTLRETSPHSGVFKANLPLIYARSPSAGPSVPDAQSREAAEDQGLPVVYGDTVAARYTDPGGLKTPIAHLSVARGADGSIVPFSKRYDDSTMAMQTQFAMAESYLELARRHRDLKQVQEAAREFAVARQLLANTIAFFGDPETRAHAEYLLGNLTMEDAEAADAGESRGDRYRAALARFMNITGSYPDSIYAARAQFQIAVVYERLGEPDIAAQEYVKLAYKYPDSENLATAMARLGTHFQRRATELQKQAQPLLAQADNRDAQFDAQALQEQARQEFVKAAQIFERLQSRFPDHELAGKAGLRAGQIYIRVDDPGRALAVLKTLIDNQGYDGATLRAEAMYWAGRCLLSLKQPLPAYALFKRITYDFPESPWAAYARAQLSTDQMLQLDRRVEIDRLEEGR